MPDSPRYSIAFWNLENLFAPEHNPDRAPWMVQAMKSALAGWTEDLFQQKIKQLAKVIAQLSDGQGPDILGVCEIENRFVLDALNDELNARLTSRDYDAVHADNTRDHRGIDTAFIYDRRRFSVDPDTVFFHFVMRRTGTRDITQATFTAQSGSELVLLCNHWPARSAGVQESAGFRATAGETLSYWHERIREERGDDIPIVAFGDFNDDPFDASVRYNANAWREKGDVERSRSARFYNLSWNYLQQRAIDHRGDERLLNGTLYYRNDGHVFDQILVNRSILKGERDLQLLEGSARIESIPEMVDHRSGNGPIRFGLPRGKPAKNINTEGYSDHFPVSVTLIDAR